MLTWFRSSPFHYEQTAWTRVSEDFGDGTYTFRYEELPPHSTVLESTVHTLTIRWDGKSTTFQDAFSSRPKTAEERFEDGIAWAALVAQAHEAPQGIVDAIKTERPKHR